MILSAPDHFSLICRLLPVKLMNDKLIFSDNKLDRMSSHSIMMSAYAFVKDFGNDHCPDL